MAVTQNTYTGNGSTVLFSFTFPYLETTDIKVSVNGTTTTAYTLANATTIQFNTAPANGAAIRIYRETDDSGIQSTFFAGSAIRSQDLNNNFTQTLYLSQESVNEADSATATANTALTNSNTAISTANTAVSTANSAVSSANTAVSTANTASTNATAAVNTANTASSNASAAVSTANAASASAASAVTTANGAVTTANGAVTTANAATSTANSALSAANSAVSTANTASSNASAAVSTANTASTNASAAVSTANTASSNATTAVSTANSAVTTANAAAAAVANAVLYTTVANVAAIPGTPANNTAIEVTDSTGIESFTPLSGLPGGFVGSSGLSARIIYQTGGSTWTWIQYFPNDPETRYLTFAGGTLTGQLRGDDSTSASTPGFAFDGDSNTGVGRTGTDELALITGGVARLTADAAGNVDVPGGLSKSGNAVVTIGDTGTVTSTMITDGTIVNADISATAAIDNNKLATSGVTAGTYGSSTQIPSLTVNDKGIVTAASISSLPAGIVTTTDTGIVTSTMISDGTIVDVDISPTASIANSKLAISGVTAGTYGSSTQIPSLTVNDKGIVTAATTNSLPAGIVTTADTGTVTSAMITDGTIVNADINSAAAIAGTKVSPNFGGQNISTGGTITASGSNSTTQPNSQVTITRGYGEHPGKTSNYYSIYASIAGSQGNYSDCAAIFGNSILDSVPGVTGKGGTAVATGYGVQGWVVNNTDGYGASYALYARTQQTGATNGTLIGVGIEMPNYNGGGTDGIRYTSAFTGAGTQTVLRIYRNSTQIGSITTSTTATAYNTSSDYRLKENVVPLVNAIPRLLQVPVHRFNFIASPDTTVDGFLAHEVAQHVPEAVTGQKDEMQTVPVLDEQGNPRVDEDGNAITEQKPLYQGIDQSKLVPLLTAALQEAVGEIESLKARVTALETP